LFFRIFANHPEMHVEIVIVEVILVGLGGKANGAALFAVYDTVVQVPFVVKLELPLLPDPLQFGYLDFILHSPLPDPLYAACNPTLLLILLDQLVLQKLGIHITGISVSGSGVLCELSEFAHVLTQCLGVVHIIEEANELSWLQFSLIYDKLKCRHGSQLRYLQRSHLPHMLDDLNIAEDQIVMSLLLLKYIQDSAGLCIYLIYLFSIWSPPESFI
jgi:hypothetical protein